MGKKRDAILDALENLTTDELKKFKLKLGAARLPEGFKNIPRGALGQLDAVDLTDKLVSFYCEDDNENSLTKSVHFRTPSREQPGPPGRFAKESPTDSSHRVGPWALSLAAR
ncbi:pyrin domain-containing protein 1 [Tupaia chinensis]|uniref:pyrin domain-containing protein 1 n=1 Tax=Tupaia chinensis TaxID=246437 RepID=UPI000703F58B|nr:pyrin domain-containing protein 1 [Tupaia chinensis]